MLIRQLGTPCREVEFSALLWIYRQHGHINWAKALLYEFDNNATAPTAESVVPADSARSVVSGGPARGSEYHARVRGTSYSERGADLTSTTTYSVRSAPDEGLCG